MDVTMTPSELAEEIRTLAAKSGLPAADLVEVYGELKEEVQILAMDAEDEADEPAAEAAEA